MENRRPNFHAPAQVKRRFRSAMWIVFGVSLLLPIAIGIVGAWLILRGHPANQP
jgi:hypothetical protein